jgi:hypothetical protein
MKGLALNSWQYVHQPEMNSEIQISVEKATASAPRLEKQTGFLDGQDAAIDATTCG